MLLYQMKYRMLHKIKKKPAIRQGHHREYLGDILVIHLTREGIFYNELGHFEKTRKCHVH